jgi:protein farnesyltransferase subunit beta
MRLKHARYCRMGLESLPQGMSSLDASRPWLCYWMVHSLELLSAPIDEVIAARLVDFLGTRCQVNAPSPCAAGVGQSGVPVGLNSGVVARRWGLWQDEAGGFAGGPGQLAHLAPTYAAVNTLVTIGTPEALQCIRRPQVRPFCVPRAAQVACSSYRGGGACVWVRAHSCTGSCRG